MTASFSSPADSSSPRGSSSCFAPGTPFFFFFLKRFLSTSCLRMMRSGSLRILRALKICDRYTSSLSLRRICLSVRGSGFGGRFFLFFPIKLSAILPFLLRFALKETPLDDLPPLMLLATEAFTERFMAWTRSHIDPSTPL